MKSAIEQVIGLDSHLRWLVECSEYKTKEQLIYHLENVISPTVIEILSEMKRENERPE